MKTKAPIIIKVKKKTGAGGHHGGAWKVAYADFVTALMAFFLVMWLVGQDAAVRKAVAAYFRDPIGFEQGGAASLLEGGTGIHEDGSAAAAQSRARQDEMALEHLASEIREALKTMPDLAAIRDQIEIHMTPDGLRVELEESATAYLFDTGSATMTPQAQELFGAIGRELQKLPNGVLVEGHTDARQYANREGYTNWELSADRANAVRRVMEKSGLREAQLQEVRGYADKQLRNPADPFDARNRRVSILVRRADRPVAQNGETAPTAAQRP
jgi:chemotaxis protein MotB